MDEKEFPEGKHKKSVIQHTKNEVIAILHICRTDRMSKETLGQLKTVGGLPGKNQVLL